MKGQKNIAKDKQDFLKYLEEYNGNINRAGAAIGIKWPHNWVRYHKKKDSEFADKFEETKDEINNQLLDSAEDLLYDKVFNKKETKAILYFLKCKGKSRGWLEYKEFEGSSKPVVIKIERVIDDAERVQLGNEDALSTERDLQ